MGQRTWCIVPGAIIFFACLGRKWYHNKFLQKRSQVLSLATNELRLPLPARVRHQQDSNIALSLSLLGAAQHVHRESARLVPAVAPWVLFSRTCTKPLVAYDEVRFDESSTEPQRLVTLAAELI